MHARLSSASVDMAHRWDIQALRGLAILLVLLHHAQHGWLPAGYLGVDIFFVISGFLITAQVLRGQAEGSFSLPMFYARRARRLLPAAYVVLALTALASPWLLSPLEQRDYTAQHWGALGFVSNIVLWLQAGYFGVAAELKPLLHFWSLSLEEQYYLLLPALLLITPARAHAAVLVALVLASFALGLAWQARDASAAFYLLPMRAWELGLGSLGAWVAQRGLAPLAAHWRWPASLLLLALPTWPLPAVWSLGHPGFNALAVTVATLVLLCVRAPSLQTPTALRPLVRLGDLSYSLYLLHWPLIAFVNNAWVGPAGDPALSGPRWGAVLLALLLAAALWRGVEVPTRRMALRPRAWLAWAALTLTLAGLPLLAERLRGPEPLDDTAARAPNHGFSPRCDQWQQFAALPECRDAEAPRWAVWGDSYAMHLVPGLRVLAPGLLQATQSSCGPLPGLAPWRADAAEGASLTRSWAQQCEDFNRSVLTALARQPQVEVVLLSSLMTQYLEPDAQLLRFAPDSDAALSQQAKAQAFVDAVRRTAQALRAQGKRVLWVAPPPAGDFDAGACLARTRAGRPSLGAPPDCRIDRQAQPVARQRAAAVLDRIEREADVPVLRFEPRLCDDRWCRTADVDGLALYRDGGHLSVAGSARLLPQLGDRAAFDRLAR